MTGAPAATTIAASFSTTNQPTASVTFPTTAAAGTTTHVHGPPVTTGAAAAGTTTHVHGPPATTGTASI